MARSGRCHGGLAWSGTNACTSTCVFTHHHRFFGRLLFACCARACIVQSLPENRLVFLVEPRMRCKRLQKAGQRPAIMGSHSAPVLTISILAKSSSALFPFIPLPVWYVSCPSCLTKEQHQGQKALGSLLRSVGSLRSLRETTPLRSLSYKSHRLWASPSYRRPTRSGGHITQLWNKDRASPVPPVLGTFAGLFTYEPPCHRRLPLFPIPFNPIEYPDVRPGSSSSNSTCLFIAKIGEVTRLRAFS